MNICLWATKYFEVSKVWIPRNRDITPKETSAWQSKTFGQKKKTIHLDVDSPDRKKVPTKIHGNYELMCCFL